MESFIVCVNAVLPLFIVILLGFIARKSGDISEKDVFHLNSIAYKYFLPVLVFNNIYKSDLSISFNTRLVIFVISAVLLEWFISTLIVIKFEKKLERRGVLIQVLYRSNLIIIGLPFTQQLMPPGTDLSPVVILIALVIPIYNILAVITLESFNGKRSSIKGLLLDIIKNPMIIATVVGAVFSFLKIRFPTGVEKAAEQVSVAASILMLFVLGGFFEFSNMKSQLKPIIPAIIGRLVVIPAIMLTAGYHLGFRGVEFASLISLFASSTAITTFTMSQQLGGDGRLANNAVVVTSFLCSFTLCIWATIFKLLGAF